MKILLSCILVIYTAFNAYTQDQQYTGEYYLTGVRETAGGLLLSADSSFEFYFSSGALDRTGKGKWTVAGNQVILNAVQVNGNDFTFKKDSATDRRGLVIKIDDRNSNLYLYVLANIWVNGTPEQVFVNSSKEILSTHAAADSIEVLFQFVPERKTTYLPKKGKNYVEFQMEQWLFDIYFNHQVCIVVPDGLKLTIPFISDRELFFKKKKGD